MAECFWRSSEPVFRFDESCCVLLSYRCCLWNVECLSANSYRKWILACNALICLAYQRSLNLVLFIEYARRRVFRMICLDTWMSSLAVHGVPGILGKCFLNSLCLINPRISSVMLYTNALQINPEVCTIRFFDKGRCILSSGRSCLWNV